MTDHPKITDYGTIKANAWPVASYKCLAKASKEGREFTLCHVGRGYEPAGSMARWTDGYHAVRFYLDGAIHGRRFKDFNEAVELFNKWTH